MRTRTLPAAVAAVLVVAALAGCTAAGGSGSSGGGAAMSQADAGARSVDAAAGQGAKAAAADRAVVTTGTLRLVADDPIRAAARITDLVEAVDGSVARSTQDPSGRPSAQLVLR